MNQKQKFDPDLTQLDIEEIAKSIIAGNTGGIIDSGEDEISSSYRISWSLEVNKFEN